MAIGRRPNVTDTQGLFRAGVAAGAIRAAAAVGVSPAGLVECSSTNGATFVGFATTAYAPGDPVYVVSMRGSIVGPIIEGGGVLVAGSPAFISGTAGEVSTTAPIAGAGVVVVQVGVAMSPSTILLNTDLRVGRPS